MTASISSVTPWFTDSLSATCELWLLTLGPWDIPNGKNLRHVELIIIFSYADWYPLRSLFWLPKFQAFHNQLTTAYDENQIQLLHPSVVAHLQKDSIRFCKWHPTRWYLYSDPVSDSEVLFRPSLSWPWKGNQLLYVWTMVVKESPFLIPDHCLFFVERPLIIKVSRLMGSINRHILNNKVFRLLLSSYRFFDCNCNRVVCNQRRPAKTLLTLITISSLRSLLHSSFPLAMRCIALIFYSKDRTPLHKSKKNLCNL